MYIHVYLYVNANRDFNWDKHTQYTAIYITFNSIVYVINGSLLYVC